MDGMYITYYRHNIIIYTNSFRISSYMYVLRINRASDLGLNTIVFSYI